MSLDGIFNALIFIYLYSTQFGRLPPGPTAPTVFGIRPPPCTPDPIPPLQISSEETHGWRLAPLTTTHLHPHPHTSSQTQKHLKPARRSVGIQSRGPSTTTGQGTTTATSDTASPRTDRHIADRRIDRHTYRTTMTTDRLTDRDRRTTTHSHISGPARFAHSGNEKDTWSPTQQLCHS